MQTSEFCNGFGSPGRRHNDWSQHNSGSLETYVKCWNGTGLLKMGTAATQNDFIFIPLCLEILCTIQVFEVSVSLTAQILVQSLPVL